MKNALLKDFICLNSEDPLGSFQMPEASHVECLDTTGKTGFGNFMSQANQPKRMQEKGFTLSSDLSSPPSLRRLESQGPQEAIAIPLVLEGT